MKSAHHDVLIVGAGLSGIGMAWHLQDRCPDLEYAILEGREGMGGTWDLFRYPGIRSDSDMFTLGFSFHPWTEGKAIADGPSILRYIKETATKYGIDQKIEYGQKVLKADWSSTDEQWTVTTARGERTCRFLVMCAGYYDYDQGYTPDFPGRSSYQGRFVHPQHWPEDLDYSGNRIIVIGSGATAVTLVPAIAKRAGHVTMLQRSPTYISNVPSVDLLANLAFKLLPASAAYRLVRLKNIVFTLAFFHFCRRFPRTARRILHKGVRSALTDPRALEKDFTPHYSPWDQRLCLAPDNDLFKALNSGKADILTDRIKTLTPNGIKLVSGRTLEADIIVSATGLNLKMLGGVNISIDGKTQALRELVPYKSTLLSGVPNLAMIFGYTNSSWTLKCNLASKWIARLIQYMQKRKWSVVKPVADPGLHTRPLIDFSSGYFQRSAHDLPRQGSRSPWKVHQNYFLDVKTFQWRPLADKGLTFS